MRVLLIHNFYQHAGGEDAVFGQEISQLRANGVTVETLIFTNDTFDGTLLSKAGAAARTVYNRQSARRVGEAIETFRPDLVHVHNLFYTASPAVIRVAKQRGIPVVMTLHNFRLVCLNGLLMREGKVPCETCLTQPFPMAGIRHACFQGSVVKSAQLSLVLAGAKLAGIWRSVDRFVVMTEFVREKFLASSLNLRSGQVVVKPNAVLDLGDVDFNTRQDFFLYVGRLSAEKGIDVLLDAVQKHPFRLKIIGTGPLEGRVRQVAAAHPNIEYLGWQNPNAVASTMKKCRALLVPSICYEAALPLVVLEAFATGTPVICSDQGNLRQITENQPAGMLFRSGDGDELGKMVQKVDDQPDLLRQYAYNSRYKYTDYSAETWGRATLALYEEVVAEAAG